MTSVQRTFPSVFAFNVGIELVSDKEKYVLLEEDIEHIQGLVKLCLLLSTHILSMWIEHFITFCTPHDWLKKTRATFSSNQK